MSLHPWVILSLRLPLNKAKYVAVWQNSQIYKKKAVKFLRTKTKIWGEKKSAYLWEKNWNIYKKKNEKFMRRNTKIWGKKLANLQENKRNLRGKNGKFTRTKTKISVKKISKFMKEKTNLQKTKHLH